MPDRNLLAGFLEDLVFYKTGEEKCSYLPDQLETKLLTMLTEQNNSEFYYNGLIQAGFRRSQTLAYKPVCRNCSACRSLRVVVDDFVPRKSDKRILKRNSYLQRIIKPPVLTKDQYSLYKKYINSRHIGEEMASMNFDDVTRMIEHTTIDTVVVEYYEPSGNLMGWVITDMTETGPSMVYSVFDPEYPSDSLGSYFILDHIIYAQEIGLPYLYLGYWVENSKKMQYKVNFKPYELQIARSWVRID